MERLTTVLTLINVMCSFGVSSRVIRCSSRRVSTDGRMPVRTGTSRRGLKSA